MNENIKYQRTPVYNFMDELPKIKEKKQVKTCISGISNACLKTFSTTKEYRICKLCEGKMKKGNWI